MNPRLAIILGLGHEEGHGLLVALITLIEAAAYSGSSTSHLALLCLTEKLPAATQPPPSETTVDYRCGGASAGPPGLRKHHAKS